MKNKGYLKDKNILYIVHTYSDFQKDPIEEMAKYFRKVYVLVRYKPISDIARFLPFKWLKKYIGALAVDLTNVPSNVEVIKTYVWYLPFGFLYKLLGWLHFEAVDRAIRKNNIKFDIIHAHFIWSAGYVGMKLKEKYKKPLVVTGHGFDVYDLPFQSEFWRKTTKDILNNTDLILTVSKKNLESLDKLGIKESSVTVLENGYDSRLFFPIEQKKARDDLKLNEKDKIVLAVGSLEDIKGHKYLIKAIDCLHKKYKNLKCYIVGGGSLEEKLKKLIKDLGLEDSIILTGHIPHIEVNKWINACDIFVLSSLNEGLPVVMLEALGCGRPVVSTNVGGIPEVIKSSEFGILVSPKSVTKLAKALDSGLIKKWNTQHILDYGKRFTVKELVSKTKEVYSKLFKDKKEL